MIDVNLDQYDQYEVAMGWVTAEAALRTLGTKPQSLYASVSRGRIRAKPDPADPRKSLYDGDDIERLARRAAGRRKSETVAADAIRWGDPVLPSAISTVSDGRLYYRGQDAVLLAGTATLEDVAALLWETPAVSFAADTITASADGSLRRGFAFLADTAAVDPPTLGKSLAELRGEAPECIAGFASALGAGPGDMPVHRRLAAAWRRPEAAHLLRRALVLLADHELNASAFATRVAASTGASLAASVLAGLATLTGPLHGSAHAAVEALAVSPDGPVAAARACLAAGLPLPGFGHRLYPEGDIRAKALLASFSLPAGYADLANAGRDLTGEEPNVDFALAALSAAFTLPPDAPLRLFALARSVGWIAHALEQIATGTLIRPRATYAGPPPD